MGVRSWAFGNRSASSSSNGSGLRGRVSSLLTLTGGGLLTVPAEASLKFRRYGWEMDRGRDIFDALAIEMADGEMMRAEDEETGKLNYLEVLPK